MLALFAPAKINWFLNVLSKRKDGYHDISSLMQCITLADTLGFEPSADIEVITDQPIPMQDNLVYKAAVLLKKAAGASTGARITLKKEIPASAGLGGGSSDAAVTLKGLNMLWGLGLTTQELAGIGEQIGSDVPFFFNPGAALIEGRGEVVVPVRLNRSYVLLIVKPSAAISSAWAYAEMDIAAYTTNCELTKRDNNIKIISQALEKGDFLYLAASLRNDLEPYVVSRYPVVGEIKNELLVKGAVFASMSGSGSAVFGVFETEQMASEARQHMAPHWCRVVKTVPAV